MWSDFAPPEKNLLLQHGGESCCRFSAANWMLCSSWACRPQFKLHNHPSGAAALAWALQTELPVCVCVFRSNALFFSLQDHHGDSVKAHPPHLNYYEISSRFFQGRRLIVISWAVLSSGVILHGEGACVPAVSLSRCWLPLLHCEMNTVNCHGEKLTFTLIKTQSPQQATAAQKHLEDRSPAFIFLICIVDAGRINESSVFCLWKI